MQRSARISAIALLAAWAVTGCGRDETSSEAVATGVPVKVSVATVTRTPTDRQREAMGTVKAKTASTVQSMATGHVTAVHVREGDRVEAGQVLVQIDDRELQAMAARAESGLREAESARREIEKAIQAAAHAQRAAEAGRDLAEVTHNRYKGLVDQGVMSPQRYDEASARWKGSVAEVAQAGAMVQAAQERRAEADARIAQARDEVTRARTQLSHARVTAPFSGIVTRKTVDVGDLATPGVPLLEIEATDLYRLETNVDETLVQSVTMGDAVTVILDAASLELPGTVAEILPAGDPASRTFLVKIDLPSHENVRSGMFGRARFKGAHASVLAVPVTAVTERGQLAYVYVVGEEGVIRLRLVTLGKRYGEYVEVLSGLDEGERIVVSDLSRLSDGARVSM